MSLNANVKDLVISANNISSQLFMTAQDTVIFRPSIAYTLQHVKNFITAIQVFRNKELDSMQTRALERFISITSSFRENVKHLGKDWPNYYLNVSSLHLHEITDKYRKQLVDILKQLNVEDVDRVIGYDSVQDSVNKVADLQYFKAELRKFRDQSIEVTNALDIQQIINQRIYSINSHLPSKSKRRKIANVNSTANIEESEEAIAKRLETALGQFSSIDIPNEDLMLDEPLGSGGFGTVYRGTRLSTGELLAVKEVRSDKLTMSSWTSLYAEVATMAKLKHRYVLELVGAHIKKPYRILTRFCPGKSLFDRIHRPLGHPLSPLQLTKIAYQVASGMAFLHENGIVHRDLKSMNILLDEHDAACIADFGLCGFVKDNKELVGGVGTPHYTAPEVLSRQKYGPLVDSYSYGVILWEMVTGQIPFRDKTQAEIYDHVVTHGWRLKIPNFVPDGLRKLILRCWSAKPNDRPEFDEIVELFSSGRVKFKDAPDITSRKMLEVEGNEPPINIKYVAEVFKNPNHEKFCSVADFVVNNLSELTRARLQVENIVDSYKSDTPNPERVLLISSALMEEDQFEDFIDNVAIKILQKLSDDNIQYGIRFFLKTPKKFYEKLYFFLPRIAKQMPKNRNVGFLFLQLLSIMGNEKILQFKKEIIEFLTPEVITDIKDQPTANAIMSIVPLLINEIKHKSRFIPLLQSNLEISTDFQKLISSNVSKKKSPILLDAFIKLTRQNDTAQIIQHILKTMSFEDIKKASEDPQIFDTIDTILKEKKSISTMLLVLFCFCQVPGTPKLLAHHPILTTLIAVPDYTAQKLQICTCLFSSQTFVEETTISDGIFKLLIPVMNDEKLNAYGLKLIGALSMHESGCKLIADTGLMFLFSQLFLSPICGDMMTSLLILRNIAKAQQEIPQVSLIASCLMQDLISTHTKKLAILDTLIEIISAWPDSVQPNDLQNNILPLIAAKQDPKIVYKILQIFKQANIVLLKSFYKRLTDKILTVLQTPSFQTPEIIALAVDLLVLIHFQFQIPHVLKGCDVPSYVQSVISQLPETSPEYESLQSAIFLFSRL